MIKKLRRRTALLILAIATIISMMVPGIASAGYLQVSSDHPTQWFDVVHTFDYFITCEGEQNLEDVGYWNIDRMTQWVRNKRSNTENGTYSTTWSDGKDYEYPYISSTYMSGEATDSHGLWDSYWYATYTEGAAWWNNDKYYDDDTDRCCLSGGHQSGIGGME